jgi:hypothetical protein
MKLTARPRKKLRRRRMRESAWQGFQLAVGKAVRHHLIERVQRGDVRFARRVTRSRTAIVLEYAGQEIAFLYSRETKDIICFLQLDAAELEGWREAHP